MSNADSNVSVPRWHNISARRVFRGSRRISESCPKKPGRCDSSQKRAEVQLAIRGREVDSWLEKQIASASEPESWIHIMDRKCQWVLDKLELLKHKMDRLGQLVENLDKAPARARRRLLVQTKDVKTPNDLVEPRFSNGSFLRGQ